MIPFRGSRLDPTQRDTIHIPDHLTDTIRTLHADTPLAACASVGYEGGGFIIRIDRDLEDLSTGERELWALLRSLLAGSLLSRGDVTGPLGAWFTTLAGPGVDAA